MRAIVMLLSVILCAAPAASPAAQGDYERAVALLGAGKAREAAALLAPLSRSEPENPYVHYHLGLAYYRLGRLDDAYGSFVAAEDAAGDSAETGLGLSAAYASTGASFYREKRLEEASECLERALALNAGDGTSRYYLGLIAMAGGRYDAARDELERAYALKAGDNASLSSIRNAVAMSYAAQDRLPEAVAEFEKTIELDGTNVEALYNLGVLNYRLYGYEAARPYFERLTAGGAGDEAKKGELFTAMFNMGVDFQDRGKTQDAASMFESALKLMPEDAQAHYYLGYNLMELKRFREAASHLGRALELDRGLEGAKARYEVARSLAAEEAIKRADEAMGSGDFYAALPLYEEALGLAPADEAASRGRDKAAGMAAEDAEKRASRAGELLAAGDYSAARGEADELNRLAPVSAAASRAAGEVGAALRAELGGLADKALAAEGDGALGRAADIYEAMLTLDPEDGRAAASLQKARGAIESERAAAKSAMAQGRLADARKGFERLLVYVPGDEDALDGLEELRYRLSMEKARETEKAKEALEVGDLVTAVAHADRALELSPNDTAALEVKEEAARRKDELIRGYVGKGEKALDSGEYGEAEGHFLRALELSPGDPDAESGLERARRAAAAPKDEDEIRRLYLSGVEHYTKGELDEAVAAWRSVLRLDPGNEKAMSSIKKAEEKMQSAGQGR